MAQKSARTVYIIRHEGVKKYNKKKKKTGTVLNNHQLKYPAQVKNREPLNFVFLFSQLYKNGHSLFFPWWAFTDYGYQEPVPSLIQQLLENCPKDKLAGKISERRAMGMNGSCSKMEKDWAHSRKTLRELAQRASLLIPHKKRGR